MYDIITVGSNTLDAFVHTDAQLIKVHKDYKKKEQEELCLAYPVGAKILITRLEFHVGGGGTNTAASFSRLGLKTGYLGRIGKDENGVKILNMLHKYNIDFMGTFGDISGYSVVLDSKHDDRTILTYKGCNDGFKYEEINKKKIKTEWFYFSSMMSSSLEALKKLAGFAKKNKIKLAFNPSQYLVIKGIKELKIILNNADILVFNKEEAFSLSKKNDLKQAFLELKKHVKGTIVITDGKRGAYLYDGKYLYVAKPRKNIKVVETTGAGDAFASALTAGFIKKMSVQESMKAGMLQAEAVIQEHGAKHKLLTWKEMQKALKKDKRNITKTKL